MILSELYIYPIKSLSGISVSEVVVEEKGFRHDRRFMLVTPSGESITQRTHHQMALLDVAIQEDVLHVWHRHHPGKRLTIPLQVAALGETLLVNIWDSKNVPAIPVSDESDRWFTEIIGSPCRLVYMPDSTHRAVDSAYARDPERDAVSFADGYPYLLIGQSSLDYLNQRVADPLSMLRFRPNLVVQNSQPNEEDTWAEFQIGDLHFYGVKPCARCVLTTVDPETGEVGKEPLRTLTTYRKWKHKILFGQNVLAHPTGHFPLGTLRVGQSVTVVRYQETWLTPPLLTVSS